MADTVKARLTNKAPGPRGAWANGELIDVPAGKPTVLTFRDVRELNGVDKDVFQIETSDDVDFDASPPQRMFLALATDEHGAGFRLLDLGDAKFIGVAQGVDAPFLPDAFSWAPVNEPVSFTAPASDADASDADHAALLKAAIDGLDPTNDDHWTRAGLPSVEAVETALGASVNRAQIEATAPGFTRPAQN
jgi:hypothetical protein